MKIILSSIAFCVLFCGAVSAQSEQATSSVQTGEGITRQRLLKTLDALDAAEKVIQAQSAELNRKDDVIQEFIELSKIKDEIIVALEKKNDILAKQAQRKVSFLFGLIKVRY